MCSKALNGEIEAFFLLLNFLDRYRVGEGRTVISELYINMIYISNLELEIIILA